MQYRAWVRQDRGDLRPPDFGRSASAGNRTSSNTSSLVSLARRDSVPCCSLALNPLLSVGTMNPRIDVSWLSPFVLAQTIAMWAIDPFVIHIFDPLSSQVPSGRSFAIVIIPDGFEPKSGSVSPKQPITSPPPILGRYFFFCSSLPNAKIGYIARAPCTEANDRMPESPRSSSCMIRP